MLHVAKTVPLINDLKSCQSEILGDVYSKSKECLLVGGHGDKLLLTGLQSTDLD